MNQKSLFSARSFFLAALLFLSSIIQTEVLAYGGDNNRTWSYQSQISITNNNAAQALPAGYTVSLTFDHASLVSAGKSDAYGNDIRIAYYNASNGTHVQLDRINATPFNTPSTVVWFRTVAEIPASGKDANYYLYYGNPRAGAPPTDPNNVYLVWDDFTGPNGAALDSSRWGVLQEGDAIVDIQSNQARFYSPQQRLHDAQAWTVKNFTNTTGLDISFDWTNVSCGNNARWRVGLFNSRFIPPDAYPLGQNLHVSDGCTGAAGYNVYRNSTSVFSEGLQAPPKAIRLLLDPDNPMKVYKDGALSWEGTWSRADGDFHFLFYVGGGGTYLPDEEVTMYFDNVKIQKYFSSEPSASLGEEQIVNIAFSDENSKMGLGMMRLVTFGLILVLLLWIAVIFLVVRLYKPNGRPPVQPPSEQALDTLKRRHAAGELTKEEFDRMQKNLK